MALGLLGLKVGMTHIYDADGKITPVTVLQVGPCPILQVKTKGQKERGRQKPGPRRLRSCNWASSKCAARRRARSAAMSPPISNRIAASRRPGRRADSTKG